MKNLLALQSTWGGRLEIQANDVYFDTKGVTSDLNKIIDSIIEDLTEFKNIINE